MPGISQTQQILQFLKNRPDKQFSARDIAISLIEDYPDVYSKKRKNPRFTNDKEFISQIVAEIGRTKDLVRKRDKHVSWQDKPRPRMYCYNSTISAMPSQSESNSDAAETSATNLNSEHDASEYQLYPILVEFLISEFQLYCLRIDEKKSSNKRGKGGNQWLHPDVVAMQTVDKEWSSLVKACLEKGAGQRVRLWSFEVKKELNSSNVRKCYFQAVSNSSWANEGYLVATSISDSVAEEELRMLSALHGIGVIILNTENPSESDILLPAHSRQDVDWRSANRIVVENSDFREFIELVSTYYQTGRVRNKDWSKGVAES